MTYLNLAPFTIRRGDIRVSLHLLTSRSARRRPRATASSAPSLRSP